MRRRVLAALCAVLAAGCARDPAPFEPGLQTAAIAGESSEPRNRARIRTELGTLYYSVGNYAVALEEARRAVQADPSYALAYSLLGAVYMELRETQLAQQNFERALRLAPGDPEINHRYGWFLCQTGRELESVRFFQQAIRNPLYPTPWRSSAAAGVCVLRKGMLKEAEDYFVAALNQDPDDLVSLHNLAEIRYRKGELEEARKLIGRFNRLVEPTAESLWLALRIERRLGERTAEAAFANQLRRRFPASREYQLLQRGEYD
ncbi:MAG: type IV pilus biogenesis/stability protein PilW [Burkholderiales bacterium]|nr:type IV pilus biogenesis/stability protein PilW [Burkholderiales bacterium]